MTAYFVAADGVQTGPFTIEEIKAQCSQGIIQKQTLMWRDGLSEWLSAEVVLRGTGIEFIQGISPPKVPAWSVQQADADDVETATYGFRFEVPAASLSAGRGVSWIGEGWTLFKVAPGMWIVALLIWVAMQAVLRFIPYLGSLAALLLTPSFGVGILAFAHGIASNGKADLGDLFAGFKDRLGSLVVLSLLYFAMFFVVIIIGIALAFALLGGSALFHSARPDQVLSSMLAGGAFPLMLFVLVMLTLMALVVSAYLYAPGLVFFADQSPVSAMKQSFTACWRNWLPILVTGLVGIGITILGILPIGLGLLIALPVLVASNYAAFRDMFGREG